MNTTAQKYRYATALVAIILAVIGLYFVLHKKAGEDGLATSTASSTVALDDAAIAKLSAGGTVKGDGYTITATHGNSSPTPAPDFKKPLTYSTDLTADVRTILQNKWQLAVDALQKDSHDSETWIGLGTLRKIAGDYAGAASAWEYASLLSSKNVTSFNNLGDLYMNYLHNYSLAEKNYLTAVANDPTGTGYYATLATMYENFYKKGTGADEAILIKGIKANPKSIDLQVLLARLYTHEGKTAQAKATYQAAITNATSQGKPEIATQLRTESNL